MKKLARKLRKNSEDGKFSLPVHDDDSRPLDSQGLFLLLSSIFDCIKLQMISIFSLFFNWFMLLFYLIMIQILMYRAGRVGSFFRKDSSSAESLLEGTFYKFLMQYHIFPFTHKLIEIYKRVNMKIDILNCKHRSKQSLIYVNRQMEYPTMQS